MDTVRAWSVGTVGAEPQRWARWAAWGCVLCVLPSILWRVAMLAGVDVGFSQADEYRAGPETIAYVLALDAAQLAGALLCLGLIAGWGERVPGWLPGLRGRAIHRLLPMAVGGAAAALLTYIVGTIVVSLVWVWTGRVDAWTPDAGMDVGERTLLLVAYVPLMFWPALVVVSLVGYWRRRGRAISSC